MVQILTFNKKDKTIDVRLSINDVYDIIDGINERVSQTEQDVITFNNDPLDIAKLARYKECLAGMQLAKSNLV